MNEMTDTQDTPKVSRFADKTLQSGVNNFFISAIIEAQTHAYSRTIDLFQDICLKFFLNNF